MANGNSGRNKLVKTLVTIIILVIASIFGVNVSDIIPSEQVESQSQETSSQENVTELGEFNVHMIDVGQADSFLLIQGDEVALVDCGTRSTGKDVVEYLNNLGITKIDYVIGTHPHDDHMGGMYEVLVNFDIGTIIIPNLENEDITTNWYLKLINEIKTGGYKVKYAKKDDVYYVGKTKMRILEAETDVNGNMNNYSIVLKVSFGDIDTIMTGDAETDIEEKILDSGADIDAEILKVGHHGSDTSNSEAFIDAISPEYALISSKVGNKYEHPIKSTMEKLEERNIEVYRTDECGSVVMTIEGNNIEFSCNPGDYMSGTELEMRSAK